MVIIDKKKDDEMGNYLVVPLLGAKEAVSVDDAKKIASGLVEHGKSFAICEVVGYCSASMEYKPVEQAKLVNNPSLAYVAGETVEILVDGSWLTGEFISYDGDVCSEDRYKVRRGDAFAFRRYDEIRRPSTKPAEKPFVFGEKVRCFVNVAGADYEGATGIVVNAREDRVDVWLKDDTDWMTWKLDQVHRIE